MNRAATHPAIGTSRTQQQPKDRPSFRCRPDRDSGIPICRESRAWAWETPRARFQEKLKPGIPRRRDIWTPMGIAKPTPSRMEGWVRIFGWDTGSAYAGDRPNDLAGHVPDQNLTSWVMLGGSPERE